MSYCTKKLTVVLLSSLISLSAVGASRAKVCGEPPSGSTFDKNCNLVTTPEPSKKQIDAIIEGRVTSVKCTSKTADSQNYIATIKVLKTIQGKVPATLKIQFSNKGVYFLEGDVSKINLTKHLDNWSVQNSSDIERIIASRCLLPSCDTPSKSKCSTSNH